MMDWQRTTEGEVALLAMPCFHISGTGYGLGTIQTGSKAIILAEFDPTQALELIERHNIAKIFMVPAAIQILLDHPRIDDIDFSRLKYITYGASPIPLDLMRRAMDKLGCGFSRIRCRNPASKCSRCSRPRGRIQAPSHLGIESRLY